MRTMLGLLLLLTVPALAHAGRAGYCRQTCGLAISHCVSATHQSQKACRRQQIRRCKRGGECLVNCSGFTCSDVFPVCGAQGTNYCCPANSTACGTGCCSDPGYPVCGDDQKCHPTPPPITIDSYKHYFKFSGQRTGSACAGGAPDIYFATLAITDSFDQNLRGHIEDNSGADLFIYETVNGTATSPTWSASTDLCAVTTNGGRCAKVVATLNGVPTAGVSASGTLQFVWTNPACTDTWTGTWEYEF